MLLAVVVSVVSASVEVAADAPCVDVAFAQKLSSAGVLLPADASLMLRRARADVLEVTLTPRGATPMRREVPAAARDCAGVDRVVVALVKAWLTSPVMMARAGRDGGAGTPSRGVESLVVDAGAPRIVDVIPSRAIDGPVADAGGARHVDAGGVTRAIPSGVDGPVIAGPLRVTDGGAANLSSGLAGPVVAGPLRVADGGALDSPPGLEVSVVQSVGDGGVAGAARDAGDDAPRWSFGAGVLGGIASGTTSDVVPQGLLSVDVTRGWFGAALDVGLSGNVSRQVAPGAVTSSWQWLSLSARAVWSPLQRVSLEAQLGLRAHRIVAVANGFSETKPQQQLFSVGAVGSVGASVAIIGPVGLVVRATGVLKPRERFTIDNLGPVLDHGSLEGGVHGGVFVRW